MFPADISEQILIRLDVYDLIRCKSVCKLWRSLIADPRFVRDHLNYSYNNKNINTKSGHRRIVLADIASSFSRFRYGAWYFNLARKCQLVGSCNGLVCIFSARLLLVANPLTRQVKKLLYPRFPNMISESLHFSLLLCWGYGYDSSIDDYKLIVGFMKTQGRTCFQVLTLKSNFWKVVGEVDYSFLSNVGTLCNGALHWIMNDEKENKKILSFDISREEFTEIHQPVDAAYQSCTVGFCDPNICLGILEGCLCIFNHDLLPENIWKMNKYYKRESWELVGHEWDLKFDDVHYLKECNIPYDKSLCHDIWLCRTLEIIGAPIFVQSLVSPIVHKYNLQRQERKTQAKNAKTSAKVVAPFNCISLESIANERQRT